MNTYIKYLLSLSAAVFMVGCTEGDKFDPDKEVLMMTGTGTSPLASLTVESAGVSYPLSVSSTGIVSSDVHVTIAYSAEGLDKYNKEYGTNYVAVPESALSFDKVQLTISAGNAVSDICNVTVTNTDFFESGITYAIPVSIQSVSESGRDVLETSRTIVIKIARVIHFPALDIATSEMSSNYIFPDEKAIPLSTYTYEIKFYAYSLKETGTDAICRLCAWEAKDESKANMLRFGENGYPGHSLQLVSPAGNIVSNTLFDPNKWYMLSLVYDGSTMTMYVNGVAEEKKGTSDGTTTFQRFELGMSYQGYNSSQLFQGRICEMRVWDRALSVTEMKNGICGVPSNSNGLRAYWKFDEGQGHIFKDATGNGYDMDWSDTYRAVYGDNLSKQDKGSVAEGRWVNDDINVCSN